MSEAYNAQIACPADLNLALAITAVGQQGDTFA